MSQPSRRRPETVARWLRWLYAALAAFSVIVGVAAAARGQYGSAVLNTVFAIAFVALLLRLRRRYP